nr:hypothetical protein [Tanacetum cinerariifolium]
MMDYALWEVIEDGATLPKTQVVCNTPKNMSQRKYVSEALLHNTTAQDIGERPLNFRLQCIPNNRKMKMMAPEMEEGGRWG